MLSTPSFFQGNMLFSKLFSAFAVLSLGVAPALALPVTDSLEARHAHPASDVQDINVILTTLRAKVVMPVAQLRKCPNPNYILKGLTVFSDAVTAANLTISNLRR